MPKQEIPKVFLDANVLISAGKPPGGPEFMRVVDLVEASLISAVTTDLTVQEVAKKHALNDLKQVADLGRPHIRALAEEIWGVKLAALSKADIKKTLMAKRHAATSAMMQALKAKTLSIDSVKPSTVFGAYAAGEGIFGDEAKKDQFPDAFIIGCLKAEAADDKQLIVVTGDGDYTKPLAGLKNVLVVKSIAALFEHLGLGLKAPEMGDFLEKQKDALIAAAQGELDDVWLIGDVMDAEISETEITDVSMSGIKTFKPIEPDDPLLVVGTMTVHATIWFSHPDWDNASYDSEDKRLIPFDTVSGEKDITFDVEVSMSILADEEGKPEQLDELKFQSNDFQYVSIAYSPSDDK